MLRDFTEKQIEAELYRLGSLIDQVSDKIEDSIDYNKPLSFIQTVRTYDRILILTELYRGKENQYSALLFPVIRLKYLMSKALPIFVMPKSIDE